MKKLILFLFTALLIGTVTAQIPRQFVYVNENCEAILPSYLNIFLFDDNCGIAEIKQLPPEGTVVTGETTVQIQAKDLQGNVAIVDFPVSILDTIPPTIQLDPSWTGYTDQEVMDMYRTFYGWTQYNLEEFNRLYSDTEVFVELADTSFTTTLGVVQIYENTIEIPDTVRQDWWWANVE
jgi:hypothetical protein